jgi:hypothetical protein
MILRRLVSAFRKQDWFTVAVEIMIVVLGCDARLAPVHELGAEVATP